MKNKSDQFYSLFFKNEYKELLGKGESALFRLSILFILTFLALGFAIGGLEQLRERMSDPFTNYVDLNLDPLTQSKINDGTLSPYLENKDTLEKYHLKGTTTWNRHYMIFHRNDFDPVLYNIDTLAWMKEGRTIDLEGEMFEKIINEGGGNLIYKNPNAFDEEGNISDYCGVVLTEEAILNLGYQMEEFEFVERLSVWLKADELIVFPRLIAVVKQLPSRADFLVSNRIYSITRELGLANEYLQRNRSSDSTTMRLLSTEKDQKGLLYEKIKKAIRTDDFNVSEKTILLDSDREYYNYTISIVRSKAVSPKRWQSLLQELKSDGDFTDYSYIQCGEEAESVESPDRLTFNFADLSQIKEFQKQLYKNQGVELSMQQIESRENFRLVTWLTSILGAILFIFGLISILLYISNLIKNHILKIQTNLGTFKAMGLSDQLLQKTYSRIALKLIRTSLFVGLPISLLLGFILDKVFLKVGYSLWHWSIPFVVFALLFIIVVWVNNSLTSKLKSTPGNLIYEREMD